MLPIVSVIVPIYNANKAYMRICITSIIEQTYKNLEILLIDDGSTDGAGEYCDKLSEIDARIKVIHQNNQGVSRARNNGTAIASGDYIMYVDADDLLAPFALEEGMSAIKNTNADMAIAGIVQIRKPEAFFDYIDSAINEYILYEKDQFYLFKRHYMISSEQFMGIRGEGYINRGPCSRIITAQIAKKILFPEGLPIGEDVLWNMTLLNECKKVCVVKNIWYGYLVHGPSAIRGYYGNREQFASLYLKRLWKENQEFFKTYKKDYVKNVALEFYCVLNYDLLSDKCDMTGKEKKQYVRYCIAKEPWKILFDKNAKNGLPIMYKLLLSQCYSGLWLELLTIKNKILKLF